MRAIVTGAASGIGRAVIERFVADHGEAANILAVDRDAESGQAVAAAAREQGANVTAFIGDLSDAAVPGLAVAAALEQMDGIDALVSNAGIVRAGALSSYPLADWETSFAVNTRATLLLAQAAKTALAHTGGSIVATSSIAGSEVTPNLGGYSASKAALIMLVQQLANELGPEGIRCNSVAPGYVRTALTEPIYSNDSAALKRAGFVPLRRIGTAAEIASVIAFLVGPDASYISGANLLVDGGLSTMLTASTNGDATIT